MRQTKVFSNIVVLTVFCIFMITVVPICTIDRIDLVSELSTDEINPETLTIERVAMQAVDERPLRMNADLVYDSESDRAIFFGGGIKPVGVEFDDTWSFDYNTNTWTNMSPATNPPMSNFHAMAYHSGADRVILFGGHVSGSGTSWLNHNETWTYDFNTNTWEDKNPAVAPPAMCGAMEYDSESDLIILAGGWPDGGLSSDSLAETWTYNLTSNTWTNVTTVAQPPARGWTEMTYDSDSDLIVIFGGFEIEPEPWKILTDTWTYDVNTNTWTEISTVGPQITGELAYNSALDRVVFYGGAADMSELVADLRSEVWTYDTNTETWEMMVTDVKPPVRARGELIYDSESDKIILFGGVQDGGWPTQVVLHDCWAYDLNNNLWNNVDWDWKVMTPTLSPDPTAYPAMTYDSESDLVVYFGGFTEESYQATGYYGDNETWTYDYNTNTWTNMSPSSGPSMRGHADMVYDEESDIIILFGGFRYNGGATEMTGDTWAYDVNTNTWTDMTPAVSPIGRIAPLMTYDSKADRVVLFSGYNGGNLNEIWTYDYNSNTWTEMSPGPGPQPRNAGAFAYDETSELCVLFGGYITT
ncbi:MAG: Kelch repeat-containing protein, partial [Candidatus Thorarchaeota archaeon]